MLFEIFLLTWLAIIPLYMFRYIGLTFKYHGYHQYMINNVLTRVIEVRELKKEKTQQHLSTAEKLKYLN
jgi:hypothetical protein